MFDALLISENQKIISELQKISAVTQCSLEINSKINNSELRAARTVLIDSTLNIVIDHPNVVIVTDRDPSTEIWEKAVATKAKFVACLPDAREWLLQNLVPTKSKHQQVIGVLGASGGLGTSLFASSLAVQVALSNSTLLIETGSCSGGLDVLWGIEEKPGSRWPNLMNSTGKIFPIEVINSLPKVNEVAILSTDSRNAQIPDQFVEIISELVNSEHITVIDLPNFQNPKFTELLAICSEVIIVVGSTIRSTSAANQLLQKYPELVSAKLVIRTLLGTSLEPLSIAKTLGLELIGQIPTDQKIVEYLEQGLSPAQLLSANYRKSIAELCQNLEIASVSAVA